EGVLRQYLVVHRILHRPGCLQRPHRGQRTMVIPDGQQAIALVLVNAATLQLDDLADSYEEGMQQDRRLLRGTGFTEGGKVTQIRAEQGRLATARNQGAGGTAGDLCQVTGHVGAQAGLRDAAFMTCSDVLKEHQQAGSTQTEKSRQEPAEP